MRTSITELSVRYNETDKMGIVHHSQYVNWFEIARTDWIKQTGPSYRSIEEEGLMMPVIGIDVHYHSPAVYDDQVLIETSIRDYDSIKMSFQYQIFNKQSGKLLVDGSSTHCWTDLSLRPVSLKKKRPDLHELILKDSVPD